MRQELLWDHLASSGGAACLNEHVELSKAYDILIRREAYEERERLKAMRREMLSDHLASPNGAAQPPLSKGVAAGVPSPQEQQALPEQQPVPAELQPHHAQQHVQHHHQQQGV